jgi:hypothetical protein
VLSGVCRFRSRLQFRLHRMTASVLRPDDVCKLKSSGTATKREGNLLKTQNGKQTGIVVGPNSEGG